MKKILVLLTALTISFGAMAEKLGVVDVQKIMFTHPKAKTISEELNAEKLRLETDINEKGNKYLANKKALEEKGDKATEDEKAKLLQEEKELQAYIQTLQQQLNELERSKTISLQNEIMTAITEISKEKKIDVVLDKANVVLGGEDITDLVVEFVNNTEKISLD